MPLFGRNDRSGDRSAAQREAARFERERRRAAREGRPLPEPPAGMLGEEDLAPPEPAPHEEPQQVEEPQQFEEPHHFADAVPEDFEHPQHLDEPAEPPRFTHVEPQPVEAAQHHHEPEPEPEPPATHHWHEETQPLHLQDGPHTEPFSPIEPAPPPYDPTPPPVAPRQDVEQPTVAFSPEDLEDVSTAEPVGAVSGLGHPGRRTVSLPRPRTEPITDHHHETPIGTRRAGRSYGAQPGAAPPGHRQLTVRRSRRRKGLIALAVLVVVAMALVAAAAWFVFQPFHADGQGTVRVTVPKGATARAIGDRLAKAGVVDSGMVFGWRTRLAGKRQALRAGTYTLTRNMSYGAAITALTTAPKAAPVTNVTLAEGPSRRELAPIVKQAGVSGDYLKASASSSVLNPRSYGAPRGTRSLEGFLFPSTYELRNSQATAKRLVDAQLKAFKANIGKVSFRRAKTKNLTRYDVLTIASMIEREARVPSERRLVSAVIYNRLKQGIPLGIDATIRYSTRNWSRPLRQSELQRDTPYNTRTNRGLPPGPIGNPGLASIQAAADPAGVNYLYYVVKPCGNGAHNFSSTDAQFQKDVAAYNRKRDQLGGKDPSTCKK